MFEYVEGSGTFFAESRTAHCMRENSKNSATSFTGNFYSHNIHPHFYNGFSHFYTILPDAYNSFSHFHNAFLDSYNIPLPFWLLPGQAIWKQGVSSYLFGTNDSVDY